MSFSINTHRAFILDDEQKDIATKLGEQIRLLRGISGTGKTMILLFRAKLLASQAEQNEQKLKILFLCWNVSLANYLRQFFQHIDPPLKNNPVEIYHFSDFVKKFVPNIPNIPESSFDEKITERLIGISDIPEEEKFDFLFVDEAQDFKDEWIQFLFHKMLRKDETTDEKKWVFAADDAQRVYKSRDFSWDKLGIPMKGRVKVLRKVYRNSARVWGLAGCFLGNIGSYYEGKAEISFAIKHGKDPRIIRCNSLVDQIEKCVHEIQSSLDTFNQQEILVIYRSRNVNRFKLVEELKKYLDEKGIEAEWIAESQRTKSSFLWDKNKIKICTAHSAKGIDAHKVIILCAESFDAELDKDRNEYDEEKLMYVSLTRAREELIVLYTWESGVVPKLLEAEKKYMQNRDKLLKLEENVGL